MYFQRVRPPMIFLRLVRTGDFTGEPWKDRKTLLSFYILIQANMEYCSFLRIDHIIGLYVYFIPEGCDPKHRTYVRFFQDLLGIVASKAIVDK